MGRHQILSFLACFYRLAERIHDAPELRRQTHEQTAQMLQGNVHGVVFRTPAGRKLAESRKAYARDFPQTLKEELHDRKFTYIQLGETA